MEREKRVRSGYGLTRWGVYYRAKKAYMPIVVYAAVLFLAILPFPQLASAAPPTSGLPRFLATGSPPPSASSCAACHPMDPLFSHPVGQVPTMAVPDYLPLDNGRVSCLTCHDSGSAAHDRAKTRHDGMLRPEAAATGNLCMQCHVDRGGDFRAAHAMSVNRAHLQRSNPAATSSASLGFIGSRSTGATVLDDETRTCLSCHDGTMATAVSPSPDKSLGYAGSGHAVGAVYQSTRPLGSGVDNMFLRPAVTLDKRIRLFDSRVGCGSCHSPYSNEKKHLVMSNYGSKLCLSCHR